MHCMCVVACMPNRSQRFIDLVASSTWLDICHCLCQPVCASLPFALSFVACAATVNMCMYSFCVFVEEENPRYTPGDLFKKGCSPRAGPFPSPLCHVLCALCLCCLASAPLPPQGGPSFSLLHLCVQSRVDRCVCHPML